MPTGDSILAQLRGLPHFRMVRAEALRQVAAGCRVVAYRKGDLVFRAQEACRGFFVIRKGGVRLFRLSPDGKEHSLHQLHPGQSFAEAALLNHGFYPVCADARATPTELLEIDGAHFKRVFAEDPDLAAAMVGSLSVRLLGLVERVEELSAISAGARLARYLLRLPSSGPLEAALVELPMAKKDLAAHLSVTPETLSRTLRKWKDRGLVEIRGRRIVIRDSRVLEAVAEGDDGADGEAAGEAGVS